MKCPLTLMDSCQESLAKDIDVGVIRQFHVVGACHHRDQEVVRGVRRFAWFAYHRKHGREVFESYSTSNQLVNEVQQGTRPLRLTSNREFGTARHELEEVSSLGQTQFAHHL